MNAATTDFVLIHSSHVALLRPTLIQDGFNSARSLDCNVFFWRKIGEQVATDIIDESTFNGGNGLSNSCAMLPRHLLIERNFREEVFSAEDQEWASWCFYKKKGRTLRITDADCHYNNPNINLTKAINEEIAIAYYVIPRNRSPEKILIRLIKSLLSGVKGKTELCHFHWSVASGLLMSYFKEPKRKSRYF